MVATFGPTYASERVADICAGNFTSARRKVRSGGIIVLDYVGVVKVFCAGGAGQTHLNSDSKIADEGRPQGAPLPIVFFSRPRNRHSSRQRRREFAIAHYLPHSFRRLALGRAPTRGAPTDCLLSAFGPGKGTHKRCPSTDCLLAAFGPGIGRPLRVLLPIVFFRRYALRRAPTRGAPTRFRQPYVGLSQFDAVALAVGVNPKVLGSRCLNQDLQDFWGFSGMLAMGRFLFGGYVFDC